MNELTFAALFLSFGLTASVLAQAGLTLNLPGCYESISTVRPVRVVQLLPAPNGIPFDAAATWWPLDDDDRLARMILSEAGGRVLQSDGQMDAAGIAWVALNRTLGLHPGFDYARFYLYAALIQPGQFQGLVGVRPGERGNAAIVADPEAHDSWFGAQPGAGRAAYWIARTIARCVLSRRTLDPTHGALFFSDARYARDEAGNLLHAPDGNLVIEPWPDGRTHFRPLPDSASYAIEISVEMFADDERTENRR